MACRLAPPRSSGRLKHRRGTAPESARSGDFAAIPCQFAHSHV